MSSVLLAICVVELSPVTTVKTNNISPSDSAGHKVLSTVSRNSSSHSHHSGAALAATYSLKPADTHIQKMTLAPTMTVSSHSVVPRKNSNPPGAAGGEMVVNGPISIQQTLYTQNIQQTLPQPTHLLQHPYSNNTPQIHVKPQFAEPLVPRGGSNGGDEKQLTTQTKQHIPRTPTDPLPPTPDDLNKRRTSATTDHTYANTMATLPMAMYTQATPTTGSDFTKCVICEVKIYTKWQKARKQTLKQISEYKITERKKVYFF